MAAAGAEASVVTATASGRVPHVPELNGKWMKYFARRCAGPGPVVGPGDRLFQKHEVDGTYPHPRVKEVLRMPLDMGMYLRLELGRGPVHKSGPSRPILLDYPYLTLVSAQKKAGLINLWERRPWLRLNAKHVDAVAVLNRRVRHSFFGVKIVYCNHDGNGTPRTILMILNY